MTQARIPRTPSYRLHKPTGQAFVEINGRRHYLGKYELPETQRAYHTLIAEWMTNGYRLPVPPDEITMVELTDAYLQYAAIYYRDAKGNPTSTYADILSTVEKLLTLYRDILVTSFGPNALRNVRQLWINDNLSISTLNTRVGIIWWPDSRVEVFPFHKVAKALSKQHGESLDQMRNGVRAMLSHAS